MLGAPTNLIAASFSILSSQILEEVGSCVLAIEWEGGVPAAGGSLDTRRYQPRNSSQDTASQRKAWEMLKVIKTRGSEYTI